MTTDPAAPECPQWCLNRLATQCVIHRPAAPVPAAEGLTELDEADVHAFIDANHPYCSTLNNGQLVAWMAGVRAVLRAGYLSPEAVAERVAAAKGEVDRLSELLAVCPLGIEGHSCCDCDPVAAERERTALAALEAEESAFLVSLVQEEIEKSEECKVCGGAGEVGTGEREWDWDTGVWITEDCRACYGTGERGND